MANSCMFVVVMFFITMNLSEGGDPLQVCGEEPELPCMHPCHTKCLKDAQNNGSYSEDILVALFLCEGICYGKAYIPARHLARNQIAARPYVYSDFEHCLNHCNFPMPSYCLDGLLGAFHYCECHSCCLNDPKTKDKVLCAVGCHDWFLRRFSPMTDQGCRYTPRITNLMKGPWCDWICTWKFRQANPRDAIKADGRFERPYHQKEISICRIRCETLISNDVLVDFDTATKDMHLKPWSSLDSAEVFKYEIITDLNSFSQSKYRLFQRYNNSHPRTNNKTVTNSLSSSALSNLKVAEKLYITKPSSIEDMMRLGVQLLHDEAAKTSVPPVNNVTASISRYLSSRSGFDLQGDWVNDQVTGGSCQYSVTGCTQWDYQEYIKIVDDVSIEYDVYIRLKGTWHDKPMTADQLRSTVENNKNWKELVYTSKQDWKTAIFKARGVINGNLVVGMEVMGACKKLQNCDMPAGSEVKCFCV